MIYRVWFEDYGDGYEDFETQNDAEQALREWEAAYGEGTARIEEII